MAAPSPSVPPTWPGWTMWQYTESGSVPGVGGACDRDTFNGSLADLSRLWGQGLRVDKQCTSGLLEPHLFPRMPEYPDIVVYIEALEKRILGHTLERLLVSSPFLVRTAVPPLSSVEGKKVVEAAAARQKNLFWL